MSTPLLGMEKRIGPLSYAKYDQRYLRHTKRRNTSAGAGYSSGIMAHGKFVLELGKKVASKSPEDLD